MNRPKVAAILSAVLASTAAFIVLSRWRLAGTITGAIIVPVIYTSVSHWSTESLGRMGGWIRTHVTGRLKRGKSQQDEEQLVLFTLPAQEVKTADSGDGPERRPSNGRGLQWSLAAFAVIAFGVSIYSLLQSDAVGQTLLRERVIENTVIEKTVTVTVPKYMTPADYADDSSTQTTVDQTATTQDTPTTSDGQTTDSSDTTATSSTSSTTLPGTTGN